MTAVLSLWAWVEIALVALVGFFVQTVLLVALPAVRPASRRSPGGRSGWSGWWRRS